MAGQLAALDYIIFLSVFAISAGIGIYHAFRGDRQRTADEYLLANRSMHPIPVTLSVVVSVISAVTYLGTPAEIYNHGPGLWATFPSKVIGVIVIVRSFCPMFYNLKLTSVYEYFELRFDKSVRATAVGINFLYLSLYLGAVIYGPALAINAVTGLSLTGSILTVGIVCTFYTTIGGIKAVMWTDVFQSVIMMSGFFVTIIACCIRVGGLSEVFRINARDGRDQYFDMRVNPSIRLGFWNVFFGMAVTFTAYIGTNQIIVQRFLTCRNLKEAKASAGVGTMLVGAVELTAIVSGLCLYAYYAGCDPVQNGDISRTDQLMAYAMIDIFENIPGIAGFQIAAVLSASLSTVSSGINALATLTGEDVIKKIFKEMSDKKFTLILKVVSLFYGAIAIALAYFVSTLGSILSLVLSLGGITNGPIFGAFCLGMYFPRSNSKGTMTGMLVALFVGIWIRVGAFITPPIDNSPPLSIAECVSNSTISNFESEEMADHTSIGQMFTSSESIEKQSYSGIEAIYSMSFTLYALLGTALTIFVGIIVSLLTGGNDPRTVDPKLLSPWIRAYCCCLPEKWKATMDNMHENQFRNEIDYQPGKNEIYMNKNNQYAPLSTRENI